MNPTEVVNAALDLLKARPLDSLDTEETAHAETCRRQYTLTRRTILDTHPWNFAMRRATLAPIDNTPAVRQRLGSWGHMFQLRPEVVAVRDVSLPEDVDGLGIQSWILWPGIPFEIADDEQYERIVLADAEAITIRYTTDQLNLNIWRPMAVQALKYLLAHDLAGALQGDTRVAQKWEDSHEKALGLAWAVDGQEGSPQIARAPQHLLVARHGGLGLWWRR